MNISFLIPSRNGAEYLKWAYESIRRNGGHHDVEILVLDDKSDMDDTWEWCEGTMASDGRFRAFRNTGKERLGISGGYKFLAQRANGEIICHWHNDMFLCDGTLDDVEKYLYSLTIHETCIPEPKNVICLTRIEPPIYGAGPEKIVWSDGPTILEDWDEDEFLKYLPTAAKKWNGEVTGGHFAPFFMFRSEYERIGGVDSDTFPFQAREDSDFGYRLVLGDYFTVQIPSFCYHFASRGNRRNKYETDQFTDNPKWEERNIISTRNFIRKWQSFKLHDEYLTPTPPKRYSVGFILHNPIPALVYSLEPWCDSLSLPNASQELIEQYVRQEQPNVTQWNLREKVSGNFRGEIPNILVEMDGNKFSQWDMGNISQLSEILAHSGDIGEFELGNLKITIKSLTSTEKELVVCKTDRIELGSVE